MGEIALRYRHLAAASFTTLLASCAAFEGPPCQVDERIDVAAAPALVAWTLADSARRAYPGVDPLPDHRGAPVVREGSAYRIVYGGGPTRVRMNGRLMPPRIAVDGDRTLCAAPEFVPAAPTDCGAYGATVRLTVEPDSSRGSVVTISIRGSASEQRLAAHLRTAITTLDATNGSGDDPRACCRAHGQLLAPRFATAAERCEQRGEWVAARIELERARAVAGWSPGLERRAARVDAKLEQHLESTRSWRSFAQSQITDGELDRMDFAIALREAEANRLDPRARVELARHAARLSMPAAGLRLLARGWAEIVAADACATAFDVFDRLAIATGPETTCRLIVAERATELADRAMILWESQATHRASARRLFARMADLRDRAAGRGKTPELVRVPSRDHYEFAPGVAAPPR